LPGRRFRDDTDLTEQLAHLDGGDRRPPRARARRTTADRPFRDRATGRSHDVGHQASARRPPIRDRADRLPGASKPIAYSVPFTLIGQTVESAPARGQIEISTAGSSSPRIRSSSRYHCHSARARARRRWPATPQLRDPVGCRAGRGPLPSVEIRDLRATTPLLPGGAALTTTAGQMERLHEHLTLRLFKGGERSPSAAAGGHHQGGCPTRTSSTNSSPRRSAPRPRNTSRLRTSLARSPLSRARRLQISAIRRPGQEAVSRRGPATFRRAWRKRDHPRPPGVGKTHLAVGLGLKAITNRNYRVSSSPPRDGSAR